MRRPPTVVSLYAPDLAESVRFYVDELGFKQSGSYGDDRPIWAEVGLGDARLWLFSGALEAQPGPAFSGLVYVFVDDVDAMAERLSGRVPFEWGPETQDYGLRELGIRDLNGYYLVFAMDERLAAE